MPSSRIRQRRGPMRRLCTAVSEDGAATDRIVETFYALPQEIQRRGLTRIDADGFYCNLESVCSVFIYGEEVRSCLNTRARTPAPHSPFRCKHYKIRVYRR